MFIRKGIEINQELTPTEKYFKNLDSNNKWNNPDKLSNCISYCNNGK